jgi:hypothetical protein
MASAELSRRVEKVIGYPALVEMDEGQRRESRRRCSIREAAFDPAAFGVGASTAYHVRPLGSAVEKCVRG